jgi:HPt (histidine-containing phosphotransfer) domain-containing protein
MSDQDLISSVAHDLKNPLGGISLNLQVVLKKLEEAAKNSDSIKIETIQATLARAERSSQKMLDLIENILSQPSALKSSIPAKSMNTYLLRRKEDLKSCIQAVEKNDYEGVRQIADRIKGSAGTFGFPELSEIARTLELAASTANSKNTKKFIEDLQSWVSEHPPTDRN